jgi:2-polyprenyl-3-methyl-5-hydroxy-6-metoxy-1,4-benzoquinol methylase
MSKQRRISQPTNYGTEILEDAYSLETPNDNRKYYKQIASEYDKNFAEELGYIYPEELGKLLLKNEKSINGPICDIGCGTGLVGDWLIKKKDTLLIDGIDISDEMLKVAKEKAIYRDLYNEDLTKSCYAFPRNYGALISAGTFTHGHLGPKPIARLIRHCKTGALCFLGVNKKHYKKLTFDTFFESLITEKKIINFSIREVKIYQNTAGSHAKDRASICTFEVC